MTSFDKLSNLLRLSLDPHTYARAHITRYVNFANFENNFVPSSKRRPTRAPGRRSAASLFKRIIDNIATSELSVPLPVVVTVSLLSHVSSDDSHRIRQYLHELCYVGAQPFGNRPDCRRAKNTLHVLSGFPHAFVQSRYGKRTVLWPRTDDQFPVLLSTLFIYTRRFTYRVVYTIFLYRPFLCVRQKT